MNGKDKIINSFYTGLYNISGRIIVFIVLFSVTACVKPYHPPPSSQNLNLLVVDGTIVIGSPSTFRLTRSKNISDSFTIVPEKAARVIIELETGTIYPFDAVDDGVYTNTNIPSDASEKYRLRIITGNNNEYISDYLPVKQSPPIDSLLWLENDDILIYVNTHDPSGNTRYYRWEFDETSEYHAYFDSELDYRFGVIVPIEPEESRFRCYKFFQSTKILVGSTASLSQDVVSNSLLTRIPNDNSKISVRYSILVRQFALTPEAYKYLQILKLNSEQTGNLFDPQPAQLHGNIRNTSNPEEPVIGYISASSITEKRIFILNEQLKVRKESIYKAFCIESFIHPASAPEFMEDGSFLPIKYDAGGRVAIASPSCIDCRLQGGITAKPSYW